jgi:nucleoid-associated protein YgaU
MIANAEIELRIRRSLDVKQSIVILVAMLVGFVAIGCADNNKNKTANSNVMDVSAPANTTSSAYSPAPQPVVAQPVTYDTMPNNTTTGNNAVSTTGGSYTVKKGDTLYSIARSRYGDGKQWQKIASANPGLRPETLKVGQTITIP